MKQRNQFEPTGLNPWGEAFRATSPQGAPPLQGRFSAELLREGVSLHVVDATATGTFSTTMIRSPGTVLHIVLDGIARATLDGRDLDLHHRPGEAIRLVATETLAPVPFHRWSLPGDRLRKVNIRLSPDWLDAHGLTGNPLAAAPARTRRLTEAAVRHECDAAPELVTLANRLLALHPLSGPASKLEQEALVLAILARACLPQDTARPLRPHDMRCLARMEALVESSSELPTLAEIASAGNVSCSTMQRLFHARHGMSALAFVRDQRMGKARDALSHGAGVAQAAALAGYTNARNFSTAFRRVTGTTPSEFRRNSRIHLRH